jgi:ribosome biogenesis GTPase A
MSIQWFPGHMHKARKQIAEILPQIDLIIQVLDARIPYSSNNPMIGELSKGKPCIKVLSKSDLADATITQQWLTYLEQEQHVKAIALTTEQPDKIRQLMDQCRRMLPEKDCSHKTINVMIMGIPNVGKSTLINILAGKTIAKTGNEPAVTKGQQRINLRNGIMLFDTPGMLWPKVESEKSSYRLATTGAIKDTAMSYDDVAFFALEYLLQNYPQRLKDRYKLARLPATELEFLETVGAQRGCLGARGRVDLERISTIILNELRSGMLGPITLETPVMIEKEIIEVEALLAAKAEKKAQRKQKFRKSKTNGH